MVRDEQSQLQAALAQVSRAQVLGDMALSLFGELRNLVAPVALATEVLARALPRDTSLGTVAAHAAEACGLASNLLRQAVDYAQKSPGDRRQVELDTLLHELHGLLDWLLEGRLALTVSLQAPPHAAALADPVAVERALVALICDARDATPAGGQLYLSTAEATVSADEAPVLGCAPGPYLSLRVTGGDFSNPEVRRVGLTVTRALAAHRGWGVSVLERKGSAAMVTVLLPRAHG